MRTRLPIAIALLAILGVFTYWALDASQLYVLRGGRAGSLTYNLLFDSMMAAIPASALLGILLGTFKYSKEPDRITNGKVERHDEFMFLQHWSNALGIVILLITGFLLGTLFIPRTIQGTENIGFALNMHFIGILFFLFGASFYITKNYFTGDLKHMLPKRGDLKNMIGHYKAMVLRQKEPQEEKFLAAERVVFPLWIIGVCGITLTGLVKLAEHLWSFPDGLMGVMTFLHGVFAIYMGLMLVAHVFAGAILPASWPLIRSMITGNVTEDYVKHHHEKWYQEIKDNEKFEEEQELNVKEKTKQGHIPAS
ncbi:formate dehydrogenase subunit gamma [Bacillus sp. FJAT-29814]|uniref:formate dehydrogenase subunit gamma n=1 Tax=Bacillus sp. FJAT-29814 TaxID=1729688 RepID=UPI00082CF98A|nr:cytochrome b/b6 domain-containing protein [Bacillus sp. FJAT-29814]